MAIRNDWSDGTLLFVHPLCDVRLSFFRARVRSLLAAVFQNVLPVVATRPLAVGISPQLYSNLPLSLYVGLDLLYRKIHRACPLVSKLERMAVEERTSDQPSASAVSQ